MDMLVIGIQHHFGWVLVNDPVKLICEMHSPNRGPRRDGLQPQFIILHYTAMATAEAAIERLCDPTAQVSAHYVICKFGRIIRLVDEELRAWHAGSGEWCGFQDMNSRSIGIELDNDGKGAFTKQLMTSLEKLLSTIMAKWDIPPVNVIGHSDMAPGRKFDPGPFFEWNKLEVKGLAEKKLQQMEISRFSVDAFRDLAQICGYTAPASDADLLATVRLRYRQGASGPLNAADFAAISDNKKI